MNIKHLNTNTKTKSSLICEKLEILRYDVIRFNGRCVLAFPCVVTSVPCE